MKDELHVLGLSFNPFQLFFQAMSKQSKAQRKKKFNNNWLEEDDFKSWLRRVEEDENKFRCITCKRTLSLSSSGRGAVVDHHKGSSHTEAVKRVKNFFSPKGAPVQQKLTEMQSQSASEEEKIKAIVIWLMKSIDSGYSNHSSDDIGDVLRSMDPDSKILEAFNMKKTKAAYVINHGLGPHFRGLLYSQIEKSDIIVLSFDESHNDVTKTTEMALIVRFWCPIKNMVESRYLDSAFFGHGRENDLLVNFNALTSKLDRSNVYHVSMDGPKVNHSFLRSLKIDWESQLIHKLVDIGSCNLHIVSGGFKTGAEKSGFKVHNTLKGAYQIFHEAPARREDYTMVTESQKFPMFFAATRWVENQEPADNLVSIWPNIQKLWSWWGQQKPKSKQPCNLETKSILRVKEALEDGLTVAKLNFFSFIAGKLQPFLVRYQTEKPMIPFLHRDLKLLLQDLFLLIVKKAVVDKAKTGASLKKIDLNKEENMLPLKEIEIGFAAEHYIKKLIRQDATTKTAVNEFRKGCVLFVKNLLEKILERSPIGQPILKHAVIFDPANMTRLPKEKLIKSFKALMSELVELSIVDIAHGDKAIRDFSTFYDEDRTAKLNMFQSYSEKDQRLDTFYFSDLEVGDKYPHMSFVLRLILTISHGQSAVERNFSIKNNLEQENQSPETIVARRICKDYMNASKVKPSDIVVDRSLILAVKSARAKYGLHLEKLAAEQKVQETPEQIAAKRKKEELQEIEGQIHLFEVGIKEAAAAVQEGSNAFENFCQKKRADRDTMLTIQAKISGNLKRERELKEELDVLKKKKKQLEGE